MSGTMEGLSVPLYGGFTSYQASGTTASSAYLVVNDDGTHDFTWADEGADNFISVTLTDATTITSGYIQSFYTSVTTSGAYSTGNTQINAFAVDLFLGGTVGCEAEGMYIYVAGSGSPTLTSANISGLNIYIADLGAAAPGNKCALQLHMADDGVATGMDAFIVCRLEGATGATAGFVQFAGTATLPEFFLVTNSGAGGKMLRAYSPSDAATAALACNINGTVYNIPMVADSCS